jgi:hypothetical protein
VSFQASDETPWGTRFGDDAEELSGAWIGVIEWKTGGQYIDVGPERAEELLVEITVNEDSAQGTIASSPSGGRRLFCADFYSLDVELGLFSTTLDAVLPLAVTQDVSEYSITEAFDPQLLESAALEFTAQALEYDDVHFEITLRWSADRREISGEIIATGSVLLEETMGSAFLAKFAKFSAHRQ